MPVDPWDIHKNDSREKDAITTFTIFCEDSNTEPHYFKSFEKENKLKINPIPNQRQGKLNYYSTVRRCVDEGSMAYTKNGYRVREDTTEQIWSVYDRDLESDDIAQILPTDDIGFTTAIHDATNAGIKMAWSNDAFELWILLHFETVPTGTRLHRNYIFSRLTDILRKLPNLPEDLKRVTANPNFRYEDHAKKRNNFIRNVHPLIKDKTATAIQNARNLEALYSNEPFHDRNPCTMVHRLVQELSAFQNQ